ncbi:hypothetical protein, partial [Endozoicomonas sp. SESOKO1]|uniref:hypothetical protein n=1 Tax=Endozoicomonas sp. SESOKO1 TaxID=2828742 RepID=UPI00214997F5
YGLLMRSLLTLNKARQFIALLAEEQPDHPLQEQQQRLHALTGNLQMKLNNHLCRNEFEHIVNSWLSTTQPVNDRQVKRKDFIKTLLEMMNPE